MKLRGGEGGHEAIRPIESAPRVRKEERKQIRGDCGFMSHHDPPREKMQCLEKARSGVLTNVHDRRGLEILGPRTGPAPSSSALSLALCLDEPR